MVFTCDSVCIHLIYISLVKDSVADLSPSKKDLQSYYVYMFTGKALDMQPMTNRVGGWWRPEGRR